jgi:uncharacterized protein YhhL (DUF1145 family)
VLTIAVLLVLVVALLQPFPVCKMVELIVLVVILIKKVQFLMMSDEMRFGSISSPNR